jgi:hypothetical protein
MATISEISSTGICIDEEDSQIEAEDISGLETEYIRSRLELEVLLTAPSDGQLKLLNHEIGEIFYFWEDEKFFQRKSARSKPLISHIIVYPSYSSSDVILALRLTQITKVSLIRNSHA